MSVGQRPAISHRDLAALKAKAAPFEHPAWIFELKHDGFRVLASRRGDEVDLLSRRGNNLLECYPEIGACLRELPDITIDGELVVLDELGRSQFEPLRRRLAMLLDMLSRYRIDAELSSALTGAKSGLLIGEKRVSD